MFRELRNAVRVSLKSPGFTLVAVATLAVGIAANTTVFSWIDSVLLRPMPGTADPPSLVAFETVAPNGEYLTTSYADYRDYRDNLKLISGLALAQPRALSVGEDEHAERVWGELVSGNYFAVLGMKPVLGRVFAPEEYGDREGAYPVAVIGEGLWKRMFNGDPQILNKTIRINRQRLTVIGVAPGEFHGSVPGLTFEVWAPAVMGRQLNLMADWYLGDRQTRAFLVLARLNAGVTLERARAEIRAVSAKLAEMYPKTNRGMSATVFPVWKGHFGAQSLLLEPLRILMAVGALVLLIVCANVANLLLARSVVRGKEFALRLALGAGRGQLVRQLLTESLVLALAGAAVGVPLAQWMAQGLGYLMPPTDFPVRFEVRLNGHALLFTLAVTLAACLASGMAPALNTSRADLNEILKLGGGRAGTAGTRSQPMRRLLVMGEMALAMVAIIGAGLFARSFQMAREINPGFDARNVLVSHLYLSTAGYGVAERKLFCQRLAARLGSQPGVVSSTYADMVPLGFDSGPWEDLQIEGYVAGPSENMKIYRNVVAPGYFDLMRIPLVEGRDFTEHDDEKANQVMIVSDTFVKRFYGGRSPLGHRVRGWARWFTIVGVARDTKFHTPNEAAAPYFYVPFRQVYREDLAIAFYLRTKGDPAQAAGVLRREIQAMDPAASFDAMPLERYIGASLFPQKVAAMLLGVLGAIALVLAAVGLYSVMAYTITQRTNEIGIRMALGAKPLEVLALVVRQGMAMAGAGLAVGVAASLGVMRVASGFLVKVSASDPMVYAAAVLFLALVALAASWIPARRATRIDPNLALHSE